MNPKFRKIVFIYCIFLFLVFLVGQTSMASDYKQSSICEEVSLNGSASAIFVSNLVKMDSQTLSLCEGDFDNDGDVDSSDLEIFATNFGRTDCRPLGEKSGYWEGVKRVMAISPHGNIAAISAHNCYDANSLDVTLQKINEAILNEADLIELDIIEHDSNIYINHGGDHDPFKVILEDVLDHEALKDANQLQALKDADQLQALKDADQLLFIEIKQDLQIEQTDGNYRPDDNFLNKLLKIINERRDCYAKDGRPVILRTFYRNIIKLKTHFAYNIINDPNFSDIRPYIRFHVLFNRDQADQHIIKQVADDGYDGVEFHYQDKNLFSKLTYARKLGLGINIWTVPDIPLGKVFVANIREEVDAITTDYPVAKARAVVENDNSLIYMNVWNQDPNGSSVTYYRDCNSYTIPIGEPCTDTNDCTLTPEYDCTPTTEYLDIGEDRFGMSLIFDESQCQALKFYDADCKASEGVLITAVVNFDNLSSLADGTMSILAKSDNAGWALELHDDPDPSKGIDLRFGVFVEGEYHYATYHNAENLKTTDSFFITAAYEGHGLVRLWINNDDEYNDQYVEKSETSGGIKTNNSPVLLGADPQGEEDRRYFFSGKVQQIQVQCWDWRMF